MKRTSKRLYLLLGLLLIVAVAYALKPYLRVAISPVLAKFTKSKTVAERMDEFGAAARARWKPFFSTAQISYPPTEVKLVGLKRERVLQVYAADKSGQYRWIRSYPILAASSYPGPKLQEGDGQVPEGIYPIESLNPNSRYHVALRVGYPNSFDRAQAAKDGRTDLGGDIMIHGDSVSTGCLAMGDEAAEDLFVLAADVGLPNITVIIAPVDFREGATVPKQAKLPKWSAVLYSQVKEQLAVLPREESK